jgi:RNA polymerase sigma-70 factor, ECF subfamily
VASPEEPPAGLSDEALAARCAARPVDEAAWREFWRRFYPGLYRRVARLLSPFGHALPVSEMDDVVQWVMLKVFQALHAFDPKKSPLRAYLNVIATSTVVDQLRRSRSRQTVSLSGMDFIAKGVESGRLEADELWRTVVQILEKMDPLNAELLRGFLEGEPPQELAERHGVTASHIHSVVYRFRRRLKRELQVRFDGASESRSSLRI